MAHERSGEEQGIGRPSARTIAAVLLALLIVLFVVLNRDRTDVSFIVFTARTSLWIALLLAAIAGAVAGFLAGRRRYRS